MITQLKDQSAQLYIYKRVNKKRPVMTSGNKYLIIGFRVMVMAFNATFNNISVIRGGSRI